MFGHRAQPRAADEAAQIGGQRLHREHGRAPFGRDFDVEQRGMGREADAAHQVGQPEEAGRGDERPGRGQRQNGRALEQARDGTDQRMTCLLYTSRCV